MKIVMTRRVAALPRKMHPTLLEVAEEMRPEDKSFVLGYQDMKFCWSIKTVRTDTGSKERVIFIMLEDEKF